MATVGVIGGGQLASMTAQAAHSLGIEIAVLPESPLDPAIKYANYVAKDLEDLAHRSAVITFENEFCDLGKLTTLAQQGVKFYPPLDSLAILVDKYQQRSLLLEHNLPTPTFTLLSNHSDPISKDQSFPVVMKSCRQGYDGKGTKIISSLAQLELERHNFPSILEPFIDFKQELAIMVARSVTGEISLFPTVETKQINQVCRHVIAPARIDDQLKKTTREIATSIVNRLNYVGILGIEFFLTQENQILVNEMAPRPHNSGHYTIEACLTSQYSQLLRSILCLPLGETTMVSPVAIMVNLLGLEIPENDYSNRLLKLQELSQINLHWYDKQPRPGRKLGHCTVLTDNYNQGLEICQNIENIWYNSVSIH